MQSNYLTCIHDENIDSLLYARFDKHLNIVIKSNRNNDYLLSIDSLNSYTHHSTQIEKHNDYGFINGFLTYLNTLSLNHKLENILSLKDESITVRIKI